MTQPLSTASPKFRDPVAAERAGTYAEDISSDEQNQE
ncbi:hypothetical protein BN977_04813 [Mycolicibacterium cosmeticum]|uniref:Uncharacterized protein n=1 Tax=Mycolicibacterium cosmeticum TaxID=258533 RepID=W9AWT4_MYCCO|nr:hypothetical protein BN977_04813 [Mycolicibacterium cosmeticum]